MTGLLSRLTGRLFAPRWQHANPTIRSAAAAQLDPETPDQRQILESLILEDPALEVRHAALARMATPERLLPLLDRADGLVRERLVELLSGGQDAPSLLDREQLVARLDDNELLAAIAARGDNQQLRLVALERLTDEAALIHQACHNSIAAVRHAAAARITSQDGLEQLVRGARRDRHVQRQARDTLAQRRADAQQADALNASRDNLLGQMEKLPRQAWEDSVPSRYRSLLREWERLPAADHDVQQRFEEARLQAYKVISDHEAREQAIREHERLSANLSTHLEDILTALHQARADLLSRECVNDHDFASLQAQRRLQGERWRELTDQFSAPAELLERHQRLQQQLQDPLDAWYRHQLCQGEMDAALVDNDLEQMARLEREIAWPAELPLTRTLHAVRQALEAAAPQATTGDESADEAAATDEPATDSSDKPRTLDLEAISAELDQLDTYLEAGKLKPASRLHRSLRDRTEGQLDSERQTRLRQLGARVAELRDWQNFVAAPKREQLLEAITTLAEREDLSDEQRDRQHQQLIQQWRSLGDAAASRESSQSFRSASDSIKQQLQDYREARKQAREHNLAMREALCEQLESLNGHAMGDADPDALRQIRDRAREEWRRHTPVPAGPGRQLSHRFGEALTALQGLIDQRAGEIAAAKQALVDAAEALADEDAPARARAEQAKALQTRWRELGRAPKGEEQRLWSAFRAACDRIFAARDQDREARDTREQVRLEQWQALIERLDSWEPTTLDDAAQLDDALKEADALGALPRGKRGDGMRRRWNGILKRREQRLDELHAQQLRQEWQQWRDLLEQHAVADASARQGNIEDVELPESSAFDDASRQANAARNQMRRAEPVSANAANERLAELRVHLAILFEAPLGAEDESRRLTVQVARINQQLGERLERDEELDEVLDALLANGPLDWEAWQAELPRFDALFNH
ncbi:MULTISPECIES: DUF349 domain-containing protein [Cobetia]|uniref:DUF349 domain-containing protein n=1 Tax=Cobetia TaxID=204286 RepID=UPI00098571D5|nr:MULTISPECIES: DUF349 domain-containing protein [Cobetia]POR07811.1 hypothetical protein BOH68_04830 [Cobetia sp. MM1IDA2H-1]